MVVACRDLARITHAFAGWGSTPDRPIPGHGPCRSAVGAPITKVSRLYFDNARGFLHAEVDAGVEYREPAKARAFVASYASPRDVRCVETVTTDAYRHRYGPGIHVTLTPGLPGWVSRTLGRLASGYEIRVTSAGKKHEQDALVFAYQDSRDPRVVYNMLVLQVQRVTVTRADAVPKRLVLRVLRATE